MQKILLVEDDQEVLQACKTKLTLFGFDVISATDGQEGLHKALNEKPDLILLDISLPKMDGMTLMTKIRESAWGKIIPIILLTNMDPDDEIIRTIMTTNPSYYLVKANTSMDEVLEKVKEVLKIN